MRLAGDVPGMVGQFDHLHQQIVHGLGRDDQAGVFELLNIVTVFSILLPAAAMVREKERGTVEQLLVSPLSPFQIVFPKVLAMTLVIVLGSALALFGVLQLGFAVPVRGSAVLFLLLTALYVFTTAGLGLAAATLARNLAQVGMLSILILAPMIFLSGAWTPPEAMPAWLRALDSDWRNISSPVFRDTTMRGWTMYSAGSSSSARR